MKYSACVIMLIGWLLLISGCKKKYQCGHGYYHLPINISFVGFLPEDLDTMILKTYASENGLPVLVSTDTTYPIPFWHNDTAYQNIDSNNYCYGFYSFSSVGASYTILLPGTTDSFVVSDIQKQQDAAWEQDEPCNIKGIFLSPFRIKITGAQTDRYQASTNNYFIGLMKQ